MMKQMKRLLISILMMLLLVACSNVAKEYMEKYDLGMRYLNEGNYEEAVLAFTAAIEIDDKLPDAFIGRGDAYIMWADAVSDVAAEKRELALVDFLKAIELDKKNEDIYLKAADIYISTGNIKAAKTLLEKGIEATGSDALRDVLINIEERLNDRFFSSKEYIDFSNLTSDMQEAIISIFKVLESGNSDKVYACIAKGFPIDKQNKNSKAIDNVLRTLYLDNKIEIKDLSGDNELIHFRVQVRPENGKGYAAYYNLADDWESKFYLQGDCSDWNWKGKYDSYNFFDFGDWTEEELISGTMKDCLEDGIRYRTQTQVRNGEKEVYQEEKYIQYGLSSEKDDKYSSPVFHSGYESLSEVEERLWWN